jgi:RimJ/RimL family protein N-acetyltransferase
MSMASLLLQWPDGTELVAVGGFSQHAASSSARALSYCRVVRDESNGGGLAFGGSVTLESERLRLTPLRVEDADEMAEVLGDEALHEFIGGRPADPDELRTRFARLVAGSGHAGEVWLNWIVRRRSDGRAVGTVQATLTATDGGRTALIAWVIGVPWQGQGFASEAAQAIVAWLRSEGVVDVAAHIHPRHDASATVATRAGLHLTDEQVDGEQVWRT